MNFDYEDACFNEEDIEGSELELIDDYNFDYSFYVFDTNDEDED